MGSIDRHQSLTAARTATKEELLLDPIVSVVIPSFGRSDKVKGAVASVLSQTFRRIEVIVVDDASHPALDLSQLDGDERLRTLRLEQNVGGAAARNRGVAESSGKYVAFLDSDDTWLPTKLEDQMRVANTLPEGEDWLIYNSVNLVRGSERRIVPSRTFQISDEISDFLVADHNYMQTSGLLLPRSLAIRNPFDERLRRHQDFDFVIRLFDAGVSLYHCKVPNVTWNVDNEDRSRVSSGADAYPTILWLQQRRNRLGRRARGELEAVLIAPRLLRSNPIAAAWYLLQGFAHNPKTISRAARKAFGLP
jgi:glycosyltransferase involved in cell wall biosynthesis